MQLCCKLNSFSDVYISNVNETGVVAFLKLEVVMLELIKAIMMRISDKTDKFLFNWITLNYIKIHIEVVRIYL